MYVAHPRHPTASDTRAALTGKHDTLVRRARECGFDGLSLTRYKISVVDACTVNAFKARLDKFIVYNYDADLEVSDTCVRNSLFS